MFRIVAKGEVELDAEVTETRMAAVKDRPARARRGHGLGEIAGTVRLVSPEVDKSTRLGRVRIYLGDNAGLRVGAFARGSIETASSQRARRAGLRHPLRAGRSPRCRWCATNRVETRRIKTGLVAGALTEVREGLSEGDVVVVRAPAPSCAMAMRCDRWQATAPS